MKQLCKKYDQQVLSYPCWRGWTARKKNNQVEQIAMMGDHDFLYKIVLVGDSGVGKSSLIARYCDGSFHESFMPTIGVDFRFKTVAIKDKRVKLQLWDTAGQERFRSVTNSFYRGAHAVIMVFACDDLESFEHLAEWYRQLKAHNPDVPLLVVGNKADLPAKVDRSSAESYASSLGSELITCSAKSGFSVDDIFARIVETIHKHQPLLQERTLPLQVVQKRQCC